MKEQLQEFFSTYLKGKERILVCCPRECETGRLLGEAAAENGSPCAFWGDDPRWSALLRMAFTGHYRVIAGPPQLILGLSKLSKHRGTPLYIRSAILLGNCADWIRSSIESGLDCKTWVLEDGSASEEMPRDLQELQDHLLHWSSILDCRLVKGTYGLEIQIVSFPGRKLPQFPTCAKLDIQYWNGERHIPFYLRYNSKNPGIYMQNH